MNCPYKRGDEMKCIDRDSSHYGKTGYIDNVGEQIGDGWRVVLFGSLSGIWHTSDLKHVGRHPTIGQGMFGGDGVF